MLWGTMDAPVFVPKDNTERRHFVFWLHSARVSSLSVPTKRRVLDCLVQNGGSLGLRLPNVVVVHGRPYVPLRVHSRLLSLLQEPCARYPAAPNHFAHLAAIMCPPVPAFSLFHHVDL